MFEKQADWTSRASGPGSVAMDATKEAIHDESNPCWPNVPATLPGAMLQVHGSFAGC